MGGNITIDLTAFEDLAANDVVNIFVDGTTTKVRKAVVDANNKYAHGIVTSAVTANNTATVYTRAKVTVSVSGSPAPGKYVYLSTTAGAMTTATQSTNFNQKIGTILDASGSSYIVHFWPDAPILM